MSKKVLVIKSSMRKGGNSDVLADSFAKGAADAGNEVEIISLAGKKIAYCMGCLACQGTEKCVINDDAVAIATAMKEAEVIAFASPIYYYSICGQLKTMLDRANPLFPSDYAFRNIYLLASAAEDEESAIDGARTAIQGWVDCFEKAELVDAILAKGVTMPGDIKGNKALDKAYAAGQNV